MFFLYWFNCLAFRGFSEFEWILIYSTLNKGVSKKKIFKSYDENLAPLCESEIVLFNSSFYTKIDAAVGDASSGYSNLSPPIVNLNLDSYDFSGT